MRDVTRQCSQKKIARGEQRGGYIRSGTRSRGSKSECTAAGEMAQVGGLYSAQRQRVDNQKYRRPNGMKAKSSADWKAKEKWWFEVGGGRKYEKGRGKRWGKVRNRRKVRMWP